MNRSRPRLDLLPLLDVFMVVLFVFATIQEERLDATTRDAQAQRERAQALGATLEKVQRDLQAVPDASEEVRQKAELEALRERLRRSTDALADVRVQAERTLADLATGDDAVRQKDVLTKLLDRYSVYEVEVAGAIDASGAVVNHCCFRDDPLASSWKRCGDVPALPGPRATWLEDGAGDLVAALRRTKGGNAMTIVRQDERATYRIAAALADHLRTEFPDHQIYDEGVGLMPIACGSD